MPTPQESSLNSATPPQTSRAAVVTFVIDASQNFQEIRQQIVQRVVTQLQTAKISKIVKDLAS
ncbi:hypothetical protein LC612_11300 [Nostoc sp. CHAB 5834]|nr:hypothetical protein [Nostoc sp. CHAB 5834]